MTDMTCIQCGTSGLQTSRIINRYKTGKLICDALGLDPHKVHSVVITLDDKYPRYVVTYGLDTRDTDLLVKALADVPPLDEAGSQHA